MSRQKKSLVGKIGYCDNIVLGILGRDGKPLKGGHYVYIREMNGANRCNVNVITSLEKPRYDKNGLIKDRFGNPQTDIVPSKIENVKKGYLYSVPKPDANFSLWSAINLDGNIRNIKVSEIQQIGKKRIKRRHSWFVGKFTKK